MHAPKFFKVNLGLTASGFAALVLSRVVSPFETKALTGGLEAVGIGLIGAGEVVQLVRSEKEAQRASKRAKATNRALEGILQRVVRSKLGGGFRSGKEERRSRRLSDLRVAAILDEFSYQSFLPECDLVALAPENWREQFDAAKPDFFLCESAWSGHDPSSRPWKGKIYASENFDFENRAVLLDILDYCRARGIPTVFWNKEDPSHYGDVKHNFVSTAVLFDHILTTDIGCVSRYETDHGHHSVHVLQFAAQPKLFNPIEDAKRTEDVVFAGGWYENHVKRSEEMAGIFDQILKSGRVLKIYDRFYGFKDDATHVYPERFQRFVYPALPSDRVSEAYKESKLGLTINTETQSETMFARRIFEMMACNTFVISNYSKGVDKLFGGTVLFLDGETSNIDRLDDEFIENARRQNLRSVLRDHTYRRRLQEIAKILNLSYDLPSTAVALGIGVESSSEAEDAFGFLRSFQHPDVFSKIILVGSEVSAFEYGLLLRDFNRDGVRVVREQDDFSREMELLESGQVEAFVVARASQLPSALDLEKVIEDQSLHLQYAPCAVSQVLRNRSPYVITEQPLNGVATIPVRFVKGSLFSVMRGEPFEQLPVE